MLRDLTPDDLDRVVDRRWDPPVTLGVRLVSVADDCLQHAGQAAYLRGLLGRLSAARAGRGQRRRAPAFSRRGSCRPCGRSARCSSLRQVARLAGLGGTGLRVAGVRLVGHRVVAGLLLGRLRPGLLRESEVLGGKLLPLLRIEIGHLALLRSVGDGSARPVPGSGPPQPSATPRLSSPDRVIQRRRAGVRMPRMGTADRGTSEPHRPARRTSGVTAGRGRERCTRSEVTRPVRRPRSTCTRAMPVRAAGQTGRLASLPARPSRSLSARPPTPAPVRVPSHVAATATPISSSFPERSDPPVTRLTVYRIAHLRWDGTKWAFAGYHESRYYLTRRARPAQGRPAGRGAPGGPPLRRRAAELSTAVAGRPGRLGADEAQAAGR